MSNATKCDRCGGYYEQGGKNIRQGWGNNSDEYDLCPDCAESFDAWLERGQMADTQERVTKTPEMLHDAGVSGYRYHIVRDGMIRMVVEGSDLKDTDVVESVDEPDTREKLESDASDLQRRIWQAGFNHDGISLCHIMELLDRQAAITARDCAYCAYAQPTDLTDGCELAQRIQSLEREIATLKEHRAGNMAKLHELTDECAELRKYRDEWKGLAEKYRADSIAAQEECERYRAKLGDVLDALHEAERAAR